MIINHNMSALYARRQTGVTEAGIAKDIEKLSSGMRINRAADDASGLAVSEKLRSQVRGLNAAGKNIQNGVSFVQTTEGYLVETTEVVQRLRELAVQSANGVYTSEDRMQMQVEVSQLVDEIDRIASHAQFNGMNLLTGRFAREGGETMRIHMGANMDQFETLYIGTMTAASLGVHNGAQGDDSSSGIISLSSIDNANVAIGTIDNALKMINKQRADLGGYQNRLELAYNGVAIAAENLQASESRIRDADMAREVVDYTKDQILMQSGSAMLAQANTQTQAVMRLLQ
ncbi:MAG: flagellin N-terminal helical domain-containing protein [Treponema sp.]